MVMFVYRDEYYLQQRAPKQMAFDTEDKFQTALDKWQRDMEQVHNQAELLIEKQRHGPTGKIDLLFEGEFTRFADLDLRHDAGALSAAADAARDRPRRDRRQLARSVRAARAGRGRRGGEGRRLWAGRGAGRRRRCIAAGCRHFFVAHLDEALALRPLLPGAMLAVLNGLLARRPRPTTSRTASCPVLGSLAEIDAWAARRARSAGLPALLHVDTGMNRLGLAPAELDALAAEPARLAGIGLDYVMTHLVSAETAGRPGQRGAAPALRRGLRPPAAGAAQPRQLVRHLPRRRLRAPTSPGPAPRSTASTRRRAGRTRCDRWCGCARASCRCATSPAGETVGYNGDLDAPRGRAGSPPSRSATPTASCARCRNRGAACFDGRPVPLVGRVSMDLTTFDVTDAPGARPGRLARADRARHARSTRWRSAPAPTATRS